MGNGMFSVNPNLQPAFMDTLARAIRASDARITAGQPLEVFALTNSEGKVIRGLVELTRARK